MIVASVYPLAPQQRFAGSPRPATVPPTHLGGAPSSSLREPHQWDLLGCVPLRSTFLAHRDAGGPGSDQQAGAFPVAP